MSNIIKVNYLRKTPEISLQTVIVKSKYWQGYGSVEKVSSYLSTGNAVYKLTEEQTPMGYPVYNEVTGKQNKLKSVAEVVTFFKAMYDYYLTYRLGKKLTKELNRAVFRNMAKK